MSLLYFQCTAALIWSHVLPGVFGSLECLCTASLGMAAILHQKQSHHRLQVY